MIHRLQCSGPAAARLFDSRAFRWFCLLFVYYLAAAASFAGYFSKWAFLDSYESRFSLPRMLDGEAERPFVYRQLVPAAANAAAAWLPQRLERKLEAHLLRHDFIGRFYSKASGAADPNYVVRYYFVYAAAFLAWFGSLLVLRLACLDAGIDAVPATLAPLAFAVAFPLILTHAGYLYDIFEVLFFAGAVLLSLRGRAFWLLVLTPVATLNKESFLFFLPSLLPLLLGKLAFRRAVAVEAIALSLAAVVNIVVKLQFKGNPGVPLAWRLFGNIRNYLRPSNYFRIEENYGVITPRGLSIVYILLAVGLTVAAWGSLRPDIRRHAQIALAINLPLFVLFCSSGEIRNLSMLFVAFVIVIGAAISRYLQPGNARATLNI